MAAGPARAGDYAGLFLIAMATLMLEVLLTRIFSVTLWHHLAFVAVSIAMFGLTLGAVIVFISARWLVPRRLWIVLSLGSAGFAIAAVASVALHLRMADDPRLLTANVLDLASAYTVIAVPFVCSGIVVATALTHFPRDVARLYAADLGGAAVGCIALIGVLDWLGGPLSVVAVAMTAGVAAVVYALGSSDAGPWRQRGIVAGVIVVTLGVGGLAVGNNDRALVLRYAKGARWATPIYEKWNSHSRVAVVSDRWEHPFGWGLSSRFQPQGPVRQLHVTIDASAETVMTQVTRPEDLDHLRYDVTNVGLHLRRGGSVYIVGAGGGRDVLSAIAFDAPRIVAVELNRAIIEALTGPFGDVTGHLDRHPGVLFVHDEARSYLARAGERFDFIQVSLIDTWAATAAGAFALSENTLYTVEAWRTLLGGLSDRGVMSVSRWYARPQPFEVYKALGLATASLRASGVTDTRRHLIAVAELRSRRARGDDSSTPGIATLLVSRSPFTDADIDTIEQVANEMAFDILVSPRRAASEEFAVAADAARLNGFIAATSASLTPPTDDRPFFFRIDSSLLNGLLLFVVVLAATLIALPILVTVGVAAVARAPGLTVAFLALGVGFMSIEIAQMMRLTLLLGHPTFSLSVVLFGMLVSSGLGSFTTSRIAAPRLGAAIRRRMILLMVVLVVLGVATPWVAPALHSAATTTRVAAALALLAPAGFLMGMALPLAMAVAFRAQPRLSAWFWGVNGAASVVGSVLAVVMATNLGFSATWWLGATCYAIAGLALTGACREAAAC
jgi:hypothetical protein